MPRQRLQATVLLAISSFPLMLFSGWLGGVAPLTVAIPLSAVIVFTIVCVTARTKADADERALAVLAELHPVLGMVATGCAAACWLALQAGVYGLAGTILYEMTPAGAYPAALVGLFAAVTVAGWRPWRSSRWRIGWLVWPGLIGTWLLTVGYGASNVPPNAWMSPMVWLAIAAAVVVLAGVLGGTLAEWEGNTVSGQRALARAATTTGSIALAACLGYAVLDMCSRLGSGPLGGSPTDVPVGTALGRGPLGFEIAEPLMRSTLAFAPTTAPVLRWLILAAVIAAAVLFARAGTDQVDALRRAVTRRGVSGTHPSRTARILHTAVVSGMVAFATTGYPIMLAYAGLAIGTVGLLVVAGFGVVGHLMGWGYEVTDRVPVGRWALAGLGLIPWLPWWASVTRLPAILAWPWSDRRTWMLAAVYPLAAIGAAIAAGWLWWRRRDAYDDVYLTLLGPDHNTVHPSAAPPLTPAVTPADSQGSR